MNGLRYLVRKQPFRLFGRGLGLLAVLQCMLLGGSVHSASAPAEINPVQIEQFLDDKVTALMEKGRVPGVTLSVVQGGRVILTKAYGVKDRNTGESVDPETTLFRIGSVTKLMTTMTVLSLVEEGALDLDTDINQYLTTVRIPETYENPITLRHMLTHVAGFKDTSSYLHRKSDADTAMTSDEMQRMIERVRAPGELRAYDNTAFGLLGILISDVTGKSYRDVVRERVFKPLGMVNTVIGLPSEWAERSSQGHGISLTDPNDRPEVHQAHLARLVEAAGAGSSTAADMALFMKALMNDTQSGNGRILSSEMVDAMFDFDSHRPHPMVPSLGLTIYESDYEGHRAIGHGGLIDGFATELAIFPDADLGIFISSNVGPQAPPLTLGLILEELQVTPEVMEGAGNAMAVVRKTVQALADNYVPKTENWGPEAMGLARGNPDLSVTPETIAGRFVTGGVESGVTLAGRLFLGGLGGQEFEATDGGLRLRGQFLEMHAPGYYASEDGKRAYAFSVRKGQVQQVSNPLGWAKKVSSLTGPAYTILPLIGGMVFLLTALVYWLPLGKDALKRLGKRVSIAALVFIVGFVLELQFAEYVQYASGDTYWLLIWRTAMNLALLALVVLAVMIIRGIVTSPTPSTFWSWVRAVHMGGLVLAALAVVATSIYWGIAGTFAA